MRILALTRYQRMGASSRLRTMQFIPHLEAMGHEISVSALVDEEYLRRIYSGSRPSRLRLALGYWERFRTLLRSRKFDLIWLEKEAFPACPALAEELLAKAGVPYVVDYDDATFHFYDQSRLYRFLGLEGKIEAVMRSAAAVVCGSRYLEARAHEAGARRVVLVPTVVDLARYRARLPPVADGPLLTVGWIGTKSTVSNLHLVAEPLRRIAEQYPLRLAVVGPDIRLSGVPTQHFEWSEATEAGLIERMDLGIMPLVDQPFERGKCGYKLIQYMACGLPVVASPIGANCDIVAEGVDGYLAQGDEAWVDALGALLSDRELRRRMGGRARQKVETTYSLAAVLPLLERTLREATRG